MKLKNDFMKKIYSILTILIITCSCANGASNMDTGNDDDTIVALPEIPSELTDPNDRAEYLIVHFWDNLDLSDTIKTHDEAFMERSLSTFLSILPYSQNESVIKEGFRKMLDRTSEDPFVYQKITGASDSYLSDNDSPVKSEELYILYLQTLYDTTSLSEEAKARIADRLELISKNRVGEKAVDFTFTTPIGNESTLYKTLDEGNAKLMLIFFDPQCDQCEEIISEIKKDEKLNEDINSGELKILAVYSGPNKDAWIRKVSSLPSNWIIGINPSEIDEGELYYLPTMPTIYLLNNDGTVLVKDLQIN